MGTKNNIRLSLLLLLAVIVISGCQQEYTLFQPKEPRPDKWATAIQREGLPNLHKVSDALYRGAQPKKEGIVQLQKLGIKTIVNLRDSDKDRKLIAASGITTIRYVHLSVNTFFPKKKEFQQFLDIAADTANHPVFIHCKHGADRTGTAVALYRIKQQQWNVAEAIKE
ncbi:MAG: dual specificity protein phosphatase family protein, partial [bacterium]|nr:dual specificity protein phosphatase family protein [bacterium]